MTPASELEKSVRLLLERYERLKRENEALTAKNLQMTKQVGELEQECQSQRGRIDSLDRERFTVKQLKDERKAIKRKLENALTRINHIEGAL